MSKNFDNFVEKDEKSDAVSEMSEAEIYEMVAGNGFAMPAMRIRR